MPNGKGRRRVDQADQEDRDQQRQLRMGESDLVAELAQASIGGPQLVVTE